MATNNIDEELHNCDVCERRMSNGCAELHLESLDIYCNRIPIKWTGVALDPTMNPVYCLSAQWN